ncbi:MAG: PEP-CTERM sorting domain-containing protein [Chthoniobacteraceae bacterium]
MIKNVHKTLAASALLGLAFTGISHADVSGFGNFSANGTATLTPTDLTLTPSLNDQGGSGFDLTPQSYDLGFIASFTFTGTNPLNGGADGFTFMLQNDVRGTTALGGLGGAKAYSGDPGVLITPSVAIVANSFNGSSLGTGVNGVQNPLEDTLADGVDVRSGPVDFTVSYNPANAGSEVSLVATQGAGTFSRTYATGDLTTILGGTTAYVGFSAATGGASYQQDITNFSYSSVPEPTTLAALLGGTGLFLGLRRRRA